MGTLNIDRYHAAMGDASFKDVTRLHDQRLSDAEATFYITQRKLPFAPCLGHERLVRLLVDSQIDRPRLRFLEQDRGGLQLFAKAIEDIQFVGKIRAVRAGTIVFANEPFADISGAFGLTQAQEIKFEHAFDLPMTTASTAMQFRMAAGNRWLSDFSLRRNGDIERAVDIAVYAFIGGFNDTSNLEAAHRLDIPAVGTEAHYWQQAYIEYMDDPEIDPRTGKPNISNRSLSNAGSTRTQTARRCCSIRSTFTWARFTLRWRRLQLRPVAVRSKDFVSIREISRSSASGVCASSPRTV